MRIGEVARRTGLSARMIRYHDDRGHLPGRIRPAGRHRYFDQADVEWLSALAALLAAGIPTATAVRALRDEATAAERTAIESAVLRLGEQLGAVRRLLAPERRYDLGIEDRMTLAFDTFLLRARIESYMVTALHPAGVLPGDFGLLSLISEMELTPALLAQMVGVAPSTLNRRLRNLVEHGWVTRRPTGGDGRSWVATITPAGQQVLDAAQPAFLLVHHQLEDELRRRGADPEVLRQEIQLLSTTLRTLLPDEPDATTIAG
jgi:DNA-binding transcriptional MerR regulator/DNA-binding MarR family transcriptional regulator